MNRHVLEHFDDVRRLLHPEFVADAVLNVPFRNVVFNVAKPFCVGNVVETIKDAAAGLDLCVVIGVVVSFDHVDGGTGLHVHLTDDLRNIVAIPRQCSLHRNFGSNPIRITNFHTILFKQIVQLFGHHVDHLAIFGRGLTGAVVHPVFVTDGDGVEFDLAVEPVDQVIDVRKQAINRSLVRQMIASGVSGRGIEMLSRQNPVDCCAFVSGVSDEFFCGDKIIFEVGRSGQRPELLRGRIIWFEKFFGNCAAWKTKRRRAQLVDKSIVLTAINGSVFGKQRINAEHLGR